MPARVLVVGAGIVGATTALAFAERGYEVTVIDQADRIAAGASGANGAQLSYSYTDAMASPAMLRQLPGLLSGRDPSFRLSCGPKRDLLGWGMQFLRNCTRSRSDRNTLVVLELALESRAVMHEWCMKYRFEFDHRPAGKLHLYQDRAGMDAAAARIALKNRLGVQQRLLSREEAIAIEPALADLSGSLAGAVYSPIDEVGDAAKFATAALAQSSALGGGRVHLGVRLEDLVHRETQCPAVKTSAGEIEADIIVMCTGHHAVKHAKLLGVSVPILPVSGYSLTCPAAPSTPYVSITDTSRKIVVCRIGNRVRIAGLSDAGLAAVSPSHERIRDLLSAAQARFPQAADYRGEVQPWTGTRPMTPDSRPIVRRCGTRNVYLNCGHGMLGWTLAAGTAERLRRLVEQDRRGNLEPQQTLEAAGP